MSAANTAGDLLGHLLPESAHCATSSSHTVVPSTSSSALVQSRTKSASYHPFSIITWIHRQRQRAIRARSHPQPVVGLGGQPHLPRVDDDQLRAAAATAAAVLVACASRATDGL